MTRRPRNTSAVRRPNWTGTPDEWAILVGRGEPTRTDAQIADAVRDQVREYMTTWASVVADLIDVEALADAVIADHIRPGTGVMLSRKHLLLYATSQLDRPSRSHPTDPTEDPMINHDGVTNVRVYGASDDLIEVEGGPLTEEWSAPEGWAYVLASTGDVIRFRLESEGWRAQIVFDATHPTISNHRPDPRGDADDVVTIVGPVHWITATTAAVVRAQ